jgi:hypothetical protein
MENRDKQHVHGKNRHGGTWVLITAGAARVLGLVDSLLRAASTPEEVQAGDVKHYVTRETVGGTTKIAVEAAPVYAVMLAHIVTLNPCLDFFAPLRPSVKMDAQGRPVPVPYGQPTMVMTRDPIVTTRDFSLKPYPVHIRIGPGVQFDFLSQMHEDDQDTYNGFITAALGQAKEESVAGSGLVLPSTNETAAISRQHGRG